VQHRVVTTIPASGVARLALASQGEGAAAE